MTVEIEVALGILLALIILSIILFIYHGTALKEPVERKENLLGLFMATQSLALVVRKDLMNYAIANNKMNSLYSEGVTFEEYIKLMKANYEKNLSDEVYRKLYNTKFTRGKINKMTREVQYQLEELQLIENEMKTW